MVNQLEMCIWQSPESAEKEVGVAGGPWRRTESWPRKERVSCQEIRTGISLGQSKNFILGLF